MGGASNPGSMRPVVPADAEDSGLKTGIGGGAWVCAGCGGAEGGCTDETAGCDTGAATGGGGEGGVVCGGAGGDAGAATGGTTGAAGAGGGAWGAAGAGGAAGAAGVAGAGGAVTGALGSVLLT